MAQVRKFESGGSTDKKENKSKKPRTIKRGNDDIDLDQYIRNLEYNFDNWLLSQDLSQEEALNVREAYRDMILQYNAGTMTPGLGNESIDSTGLRKNKENSEGFDPYRTVLNFFNDTLLKQDIYEAPKLPKFGSAEAWNNYLSKLKINYNLFNLMSLEEQNLYILNTLLDYLKNIDPEEYEGFDSKYGDAVLNAFNLAIADLQLSAKEKMDLSRIGIDLSSFYPTKEPEPERTPLELAQDEYLLALLLGLTQALKHNTDLLNLMNLYLALPDRNLKLNLGAFNVPVNTRKYDDYTTLQRSAWAVRSLKEFELYLNTHNVYTKDPSFWNLKGSLSNFGVTRNLRFKKGNDTWMEVGDDWTNGLIFKYLMDLYAGYHNESTNNEPMPTTPEGHHIMMTANGYARLYDPGTGTLYDKPVAQINGLMGVLPEFSSYTPILTLANGGVLKALFGMKFDNVGTFAQIKAQHDEEVAALKEAELNAAIQASGKTKELYLAGLRKPSEEGWTAVDYTRMGAIVGDITSMIAAFIPGYGTAASAVTGIGATLANLGADIADDSVSTWDAVKGLGIGLAMDAVGLIPGFGGAGKTLKIAKTAVKYVPRIITLANAGAIALNPEIHKSLAKLTSDESLTVSDWKNVALAFLAAAGVSRAGAALLKAAAMKQQAKITGDPTKTPASIQTAKGELTVGKDITESEFNALKGAKNLKEANAILKNIDGLKENSFINTSRKSLTPWNKKVSRSAFKDATETTETSYDFSKVSPRFGNINNKWSDVGIFSRMYNYETGNVSSWNPYNWFLGKSSKNTPKTLQNKSLGIRGLLPAPKTTLSTTGNRNSPVDTIIPPTSPLSLKPITPIAAPNRQTLGLKMPRRFLLADGRIAENLKYNGQHLDANNIRQLISSGNWSFMNKSEVASIIPGANNAIFNIHNPSKIYFWKLGNKIPFTSLTRDIIKADAGTQLWYNGITDYDPTKYTYSYDTTKLVNGDMSDDNFDAWVSNVNGYGLGRYKPSTGNSRAYTTSVEASPYYQLFGRDLIGTDGKFTDVGEAWAKAVDSNLPSGSLASFYDENGNLRTLWNAKLNDTYGRKSKVFTNLADYVNYIRNDLILGARHNVFLNTGKRYFYTDLNGVKHWVDPNEVSKYRVSENPVNSEWNNDHTVYWNDYELTGPIGEEPLLSPVNPINDPSKIKGGDDRTRKLKESEIDPMIEMYPKAISAARLFGTLSANDRIYNIMKRGIKPTIFDTYELYSPITGAKNIRASYADLAGLLRHLVTTSPTSDASLFTAALLDANKLARELEEKGFLADDAEIKRTSEYAQQLRHDNIARRTELANKNKQEINNVNRTLAQLESDYKLKNWEAIAGWMTERLLEANLNLIDYKNFMEEANYQKLKQDYDTAIYAEKQALAKKIASGQDYSAEMDAYVNKARLAAVDMYNKSAMWKLRLNRWRGYNPIILGYRYLKAPK